jgi:hypothetical protein
MKKTVSVLLAAGFLAVAAWPAFAGGHGHGGYPGGVYYRSGGFPAGAFFAGLIGGAILTTVIANTQPAVAYVPPPPPQVWVPGRYEMRFDRQWVPGHWERDRVWVPGHYRDVQVQVWVPGHWEERG